MMAMVEKTVFIFLLYSNLILFANSTFTFPFRNWFLGIDNKDSPSHLEDHNGLLDNGPIRNTSNLDNEIIRQVLNITSCGQRSAENDSLDTFIVGGKQSEPNSWPWMVGIFRRGRFVCGGSLINSQYILTAAHCVSRGDGSTWPKEQLKVLIGAHYIQPISTTPKPSIQLNITTNINGTKISFNNIKKHKGIMMEISRVIPHESYTILHMQNDIAMLKLNESLDLITIPTDSNQTLTGQFYQPVCLPNVHFDQKEFDGYNSTIIGWGHQREGGHIMNTLHEVQVPIISNEKCRKTYGQQRIKKQQICAAHPKGGKDSCQGDSGGPLVIFDKNEERYYQLGIVSWGRGCARPETPGVYTRVSEYIDWILKQVKQKSSTTTTIPPAPHLPSTSSPSIIEAGNNASTSNIQNQTFSR